MAGNPGQPCPLKVAALESKKAGHVPPPTPSPYHTRVQQNALHSKRYELPCDLASRKNASNKKLNLLHQAGGWTRPLGPLPAPCFYA